MLRKIPKCKQFIPLMASLLTPVLATSAQAVTVNLVTTQDPFGNDVTGVGSVEDIIIIERGVQLPGDDFTSTVTSTYRIDFLFGTFNDIFGDPNQDFQCGLDVNNSLCFWENDSQAEFVIDQMNSAFNSIVPDIPGNVIGTVIDPDPPDVPPFLTNINNFYFIPKGFDSNNNLIVSRQGRNNGAQWITEGPDFDAPPGAVSSYAGATLTAQETVAEIPESSHVIGVIVTGLSMILFTKKK